MDWLLHSFVLRWNVQRGFREGSELTVFSMISISRSPFGVMSLWPGNASGSWRKRPGEREVWASPLSPPDPGWSARKRRDGFFSPRLFIVRCVYLPLTKMTADLNHARPAAVGRPGWMSGLMNECRSLWTSDGGARGKQCLTQCLSFLPLVCAGHFSSAQNTRVLQPDPGLGQVWARSSPGAVGPCVAHRYCT